MSDELKIMWAVIAGSALIAATLIYTTSESGSGSGSGSEIASCAPSPAPAVYTATFGEGLTGAADRTRARQQRGELSGHVFCVSRDGNSFHVYTDGGGHFVYDASGPLHFRSRLAP